MDDLLFGKRNKRGDWAPDAPLRFAPLWDRPRDLRRIAAWLWGYIWPWNAFHMATALAYWAFILPPVATMATLSWGWALRLYAANALGIFLLYGAVELTYYVRRKQGTRFKYNGRFPADHPSDVFWFRSQNIDNFLRSLLVSVPLWTLVQVLFLHAFATGWAPWVSLPDHPLYLVALVFLAPVIHELHFFALHWLIHQGPLYRYIHSVHHNSVNPSPWSSLSMHPVEAFLYHAVAFWHLLIPSHPVVALFQLHIAGYGALNGHIGFDRLELTGERTLESHAYAHYLHHKYFEVNYGGDGVLPLDRWLGSWHDGTAEGEARMNARFQKKKARLNARKERGSGDGLSA